MGDHLQVITGHSQRPGPPAQWAAEAHNPWQSQVEEHSHRFGPPASLVGLRPAPPLEPDGGSRDARGIRGSGLQSPRADQDEGCRQGDRYLQPRSDLP